MLRHVIARTPLLRTYNLAQTTRCIANRHEGEAGEEELAAARKWLASLNADTIRNKAACDISFSRSSGPGGQNVNKYVVRYINPLTTPNIRIQSLLEGYATHTDILSSPSIANSLASICSQVALSRFEDWRCSDSSRRLTEAER
jgi:peptidyl-tRNA hydrolase ICT1